jgi:hypothetical protein
MSYAERHSNILTTEASLVVVERLLTELWANVRDSDPDWRVRPFRVMDNKNVTPVGIAVFYDSQVIQEAGFDPNYIWGIVMDVLATTSHPHFLMDLTTAHLESGVEAPQLTPLVLTEDELEELDDQIRLKVVIEESLREFFGDGWFSVAVKQTPKPTLVVHYDEEHAKRQGYNQRRMRTFVREVLRETEIVHDFTGVNFTASAPWQQEPQLMLFEDFVVLLHEEDVDAVH